MNRHERRANASRVKRGLAPMHFEPMFSPILDQWDPEPRAAQWSREIRNEISLFDLKNAISKLEESNDSPTECYGCGAKYWFARLPTSMSDELVEAVCTVMRWQKCPCGVLSIEGAWLFPDGNP